MTHSGDIWTCPETPEEVRAMRRPPTYRERYDHDVALNQADDPDYIPPYERPPA